MSRVDDRQTILPKWHIPTRTKSEAFLDMRQGAAIGRDDRKQLATLDLSRRPRPIRRFLRNGIVSC
jgi:hypothetical protein